MVYAVIKTRDGKKRQFKANDEEAISDFIYGIMGASDEEESSGCPTFMEASGWCYFAGVGEVFERSKFEIEIVEV